MEMDGKLRLKIYSRDRYFCQLCGTKVILTRNIKEEDDYKLEASIDHIIPVIQGGDNTEKNLRTVCRSCNSRKKDKDDIELRFLDLSKGEFTRIHNAILFALARTKLNTQEARILFAIIAKTYGYGKSSDWIANSQLEEITGIHRCHCSGTVSRLKRRNIVTQTGNKIQLNKYFFKWRELPEQVTRQKEVTLLPKQVFPVTQTGNPVLPEQVTTKDNYTKDINTKDSEPEPIKNTLDAVRKRLEDKGVLTKKVNS